MRSHITLASLIMVFAAILLVGVLSQLPVQAASTGATFVVTNLQDSGSGSLRDEIDDANAQSGQSTITFYVSGTIKLSSTLPAINHDITIDGTGHAITVSGKGAVQVMTVDVSGTLDLQSITIVNGSGQPCGGGLCGGGIYNAGSLTLVNSTLTGNSVNYDCGVQACNGGGIYNTLGGTLTIISSTISGGGALYGGGIYNLGVASVIGSIVANNSAIVIGGIYNGGQLTVTNSTLTGNNSMGLGGAIGNDGKLTVINSTFSGNAIYIGSLINKHNMPNMSNYMVYGYGGGIDNAGILTVINSTFSGNSVNGGYGNGGGIDNEGAGTLIMINNTFSGNGSVYGGGGLYNEGILTMTNSIIANSTSGGDCVNYGAIIGSNNLIGGVALTACGLINGIDSNLINVDPLLGPLANNGTFGTQTFSLRFGSPAIDAGDDAACPSTDQRGVHRPIGPHCDIGAYEAPVTVLLLPVVRR